MSNMNRRSFLGTSAAVGGAASLAYTAGTSPAHGDDVSTLGKTPHTKFAVNVEMWWRKLPFLDRIRTAAAFGYPAVEFWKYKGKDVDAIAKLTRELKIEIAQISAWGFTPGMNNPKNEDAFVATVEEACQVAHRLDCEKMTVVAGNNQPGMTQEQMHDQVIKALRRAVASTTRVTVCMEAPTRFASAARSGATL